MFVPEGRSLFRCFHVMGGAVWVAMRPDDVMEAGAVPMRSYDGAVCQVKAPFVVALGIMFVVLPREHLWWKPPDALLVTWRLD